MRTAFILLFIISTFLFTGMLSDDDKFFGNIVSWKALLSKDYHITTGVHGIPSQFGLISSALAEHFIKHIGTWAFICALMLLAFLFFMVRDALTIALLPLFVGLSKYFFCENLNFIAILLFALLLFFRKKDLPVPVRCALAFITVNLSPPSSPFVLAVMVLSGIRSPLLLLAVPINLFLIPAGKVYYLPAFLTLQKHAPFLEAYIVLTSLYFLFRMQRRILPVFLILATFTAIEWEALPFLVVFSALSARRTDAAPSSVFVPFILILLFAKGIPLGNGKVLLRENRITRIYDYFLDVRRMPHFGSIFNVPPDGYTISASFFPNVAANHALYAKSSVPFKNDEAFIFKHDLTEFNPGETGVIILPANMLYDRNSVVYSLLSTDNWLLTYLDGKYIVFDRSPNLKGVKYYEPYFIQKMLSSKEGSAERKSMIRGYLEKLTTAYRDPGSINMVLFFEYFFNEPFYLNGIKKRAAEFRRTPDMLFIRTLNGDHPLNSFISRYPYDHRGWYLFYKRTGNPAALRLAHFLNSSNASYKAELILKGFLKEKSPGPELRYILSNKSVTDE